MDFFKTLFTKKEVKVCLKFLLEYVQSIQNLDIKRKDPVWFNIALEDIKLKTEKSLRDNSVQISESIISKNVDPMTIVLQTFFHYSKQEIILYNNFSHGKIRSYYKISKICLEDLYLLNKIDQQTFKNLKAEIKNYLE